jgi:hypothetical protein
MRAFLSIISCVIWLGQSTAVFGQSNVEPEADAVLKAMHTYMSGLDSLLISADISEDTVYGDEHKLQFGGTLTLGVQRPAKFFAVHHADFENRRMYLNEGTFTVFDEDVNVYAQTSAPGPLDEVFSRLHADYGISSPGGELFSGKAYELLVENASKVIYVGVSDVSGEACHHIAGVLENMDWQLWVRKDGEPRPCRYVVTDRDVPMAPQFSVTFKEWKANADISDQEFDFQAPADAEAIEFVR